MPVNTSSTGATYGKSSDPLCPLGFHPQVRWPTRCKRCFRDYKEHSDSGDQKKFSNLGAKAEDSDPWSVRKTSFQKSRSVDVAIESGGSAATRFASYTTTAETAAQSKTEEDIPEWKKAMLDRRKKDKEREEEEQKARNFGFIPGTTLHSSYVNKTYDTDSRLSTWGSASNLRSSNSYTNINEPEEDTSSYRRTKETSTDSTRGSTSSWSTSRTSVEKKAEPELTPYEKYLQRKREQDKKDEDDTQKKDEDKREEERKKERKREEEKKKEEEAEKEKVRKKEKEREEKRLEEERKKKEEEEKKKKEAESKSSSTSKWGAQAKTNSTPAPVPEKPKPKWGAAAAVDEVPKRKPWEKPSAAAKSTLPSLNESAPKNKVSFNDKPSVPRKTSESDSDSVSISNKNKANHSDSSDHDCGVKNELEAVKNELRAVKSRNEVLERMQGDAIKKTPLTLESAKASEATAELIKAREKIRDLDTQLNTNSKDKKASNLKIKELESTLERRPQVSETQKTITELQTKLKFVERKCEDLAVENDDLRGNVQNLEVELEEVQDNFREDEADEYRTLKRELENSAKNCRVLQFKLKKTEKSLGDVQSDHNELEAKLKTLSGGSGALDNMTKVKQLEKDLEAKTMQINRLEAEMKTSKPGTGPRRGGPGPCLSRTGSVERNVEDQLLKDLQDSIERENDLKEQLNMAEEEAGESRKKLSRLEDENESLSGQLKRMTTKNKGARRSPSPYNRNSVADKDEGISEDGEELSPAELKVQLEVSEQETELLRKKVENLLTENLKITKEVKEITSKLSEAKKTPATRSYGTPAKDTNSTNEKKIEELQTEVNTFRVKMIEKDRELERLDAQVKSGKTSGKTLKRTGSQDEDLLKKLSVIEKEAEVLRTKTQELESENENLKSASKKKLPASTQEKLSMDKFTLEEKVKGLETKLKESNKKITELEDSNKGTMKTSLELDRIKREKTSLETEIVKLKDTASAEKRKTEKIERETAGINDKAEKAQRELIAAEREKRRAEEEKNKLDAQVNRLETDLRSVTREKDRYKDESDTARQKNKDNLSQTQEGMKAFKDQIDALKQELSDEKRSGRDLKRQIDDKTRTSENEVSNIKHDMDKQTSDLDERKKKVRELEEKITDIEEKWTKSKRINQQRKDKIDKLEQDLESNSKGGSACTDSSHLEAENKVKELEKQIASKSNGGSSWEVTKLNKEIDTLKTEKSEVLKKHEQLEEEYVILKAKLTMEKDDMSSGYGNMKDDYNTIKGELMALRTTYNSKSDDWIKDKLDLEKQISDLENSIKTSAGNGWDAERNRFKSILEDRDSQITNLKIESDVARSQHTQAKKENEDMKQKLQDYEKMNRYGKSAAGSNSSTDSTAQVDELKKQLAVEQKENKSGLNNIKMKSDSKIAIMTEEIHALKSQSSKYRRERETYKEMFEGVQKKLTENKAGKLAPGDVAAELNDARGKISDMSYQLHVLEDELADAKMESAKSHANMTAQQSNFEIQVSELNSKINEMEEESLIDSGRARIAGTRTKMELAWQKERESQKKLINELNTMSRDLKSTLLEVEKEKERERLDSKRKVEAMKRAFDEEHDDTKKQITDLQYDLLELRDAHAKLRTTNEKLRRDKDKSVDDVRFTSKSRAEYGEEKKISRLIADMDEFLQVAPKFLGSDILVKEERNGRPSTRVKDDEKSIAKMEFKSALFRVKETKEELEQLHKISEEEVKRRGMKRGESMESNMDESPRGRSGIRNASQTASSQKRALYRKAVSMGDGMAENANIWQSKESVGSNESLASNASIPLPIPVRTRSARGGSESGYSSDTYNAMTIKRLERDTSVDRLSTGSRESMQSTQSELLPGERKKSKGLLGKLKSITSKKDRNISEEREFGSGSDISSASVQSKQSTSSKMSTASRLIQRARSASKDRMGASKEKAEEKAKATPFGPPGNANAAFDKYFDKAGGAAPTPPAKSGATATATPTSTPSSVTSSSTLPRTYRRF
eukprot:GFUD01041465.1.p1 GENE.GFUD01041465.1~~GFUD01041465.1.p1  ORF type:complete len:1997 (+),score=598.99 GFUD01041465.1:524-6514(+)